MQVFAALCLVLFWFASCLLVLLCFIWSLVWQCWMDTLSGVKMLYTGSSWSIHPNLSKWQNTGHLLKLQLWLFRKRKINFASKLAPNHRWGGTLIWAGLEQRAGLESHHIGFVVHGQLKNYNGEKSCCLIKMSISQLKQQMKHVS